MSTSVRLKGPPDAPLAKPLKEAVWQAWMAKGRAQDRRSNAARLKAVTWASIAGLLAAAGLWSYLSPYEVVVRFTVAAGAIIVILHVFDTQHYAFAAVFGALALLYNPVAPMFSFSGDWQRAIVVASAAPFVASLAWRRERTAHND